MAIQFNCPYCTANIRVADAAAGKQGTCPKCGTKLIVPLVGLAAESSPKEKPPPASDSSAPIVPELDPVGVKETPSIARIVKQRAKRKGIHPLVPVLLFGVVFAVVLYSLWRPGKKLEGKLTAERIEDFTIPPGRIDKSAFRLSPEETASTLEEMAQHPPAGVLVRDWFEMRFRPDAKGLEVLIRKTSATEVFRVPIGSSVRRFLKEHQEDLIDRQQSEFQEAAKRFVQDWQVFREKELPLEMEAYRNSLGFNRLTGAAGYCLVAQIGARSYRAVHEDGDGNLYFLLPRKTVKFIIKGREFPGGEVLFPGRFTVEVQNPLTAEPPAESTASAPSPTPEDPPQSDAPHSNPSGAR